MDYEFALSGGNSVGAASCGAWAALSSPETEGAEPVYRYLLGRSWDLSLPRALWCLVNPSTARADVDDPTQRKVVMFSKALGFGSVEIVNLFSYRATDPDRMRDFLRERGTDAAVGPETDALYDTALECCSAVFAGWGPKPWARERAARVTKILRRRHNVLAMRLTSDGSPEHPLFLPKALKPVIYAAKE